MFAASDLTNGIPQEALRAPHTTHAKGVRHNSNDALPPVFITHNTPPDGATRTRAPGTTARLSGAFSSPGRVNIRDMLIRYLGEYTGTKVLSVFDEWAPTHPEEAGQAAQVALYIYHSTKPDADGLAQVDAESREKISEQRGSLMAAGILHFLSPEKLRGTGLGNIADICDATQTGWQQQLLRHAIEMEALRAGRKDLAIETLQRTEGIKDVTPLSEQLSWFIALLDSAGF